MVQLLAGMPDLVALFRRITVRAPAAAAAAGAGAAPAADQGPRTVHQIHPYMNARRDLGLLLRELMLKAIGV